MNLAYHIGRGYRTARRCSRKAREPTVGSVELPHCAVIESVVATEKRAVMETWQPRMCIGLVFSNYWPNLFSRLSFEM